MILVYMTCAIGFRPCFKHFSVNLSPTEQVTQKEFATLPTAAMDEYMNDIKEKHPAHRERFSNQAWLLQGKRADHVLQRLRKR